MEPDVAMSVRQLQELLVMPQWNEVKEGDTRGYAFLMLAEGAIHSIVRSAKARNRPPEREITGSAAATIGPSWRGTYDGRFTIELRIDSWSGLRFTGIMIYPDRDTATRVTGTAEDVAEGVRLTWTEQEYAVEGQRGIDFNGSYQAIVQDGIMNGFWSQGNRRIAEFTMRPVDGTVGASVPAERGSASR
jgi:hypothetical protein